MIGQRDFPVWAGVPKLDLRTIAGLAAWRDLSDPSSYILGTGLNLWADKSGQSAGNVFASNVAASGSYGVLTYPTFGAGDFTVSAKLTPANFAVLQNIVSGALNSFGFFVNTTGSILTSKVSVGTNNGSTSNLTALATSTIAYVKSGTTGTYYINNATAGTTPDARNYSVASAGLAYLFAGTVNWLRCYSVALDAAGIAADAAGIVQANCTLNIDCSLAAKLAASFVCPTGQTVTMGTTGDFGARICGARDAVNLTAANQLALTGGLGVSDGISKCIASAPYALAQPFTRMLVARIDTWASGKYLLDGGAVNTGALLQTTGSPKISISAGSTVAENSGLTIGQLAVIFLVINGASSSLQINRGAPVAGNAGAGNANGMVFGCSGALANFATASVAEMADFAGVLDAGTITRIVKDRINKWHIAG